MAVEDEHQPDVAEGLEAVDALAVRRAQLEAALGARHEAGLARGAQLLAEGAADDADGGQRHRWGRVGVHGRHLARRPPAEQPTRA